MDERRERQSQIGYGFWQVMVPCEIKRIRIRIRFSWVGQNEPSKLLARAQVGTVHGEALTSLNSVKINSL